MSVVASSQTTAPVGPEVARRALIGLDFRLVLRGAVILVAVSAGLTAVVVLQYQTTFSSAGAVGSLEVLAQNPAIRGLFGVPRALDDAGGFTVWRMGTIVVVAAGAWGLAAATKLTRGEEDTGRAWLTLVGSLRLQSALLLHLFVVGVVEIGLGAAIGLAMIASGAGVRGAAVYGAGVALVGLLFAAIGGGCAQLIGERRLATGLSAGLLLLGLLARMVADAVDMLRWVSWLTPFGLLSLSEPYAGDKLLPLSVLLAEVVLIAALAWLVAGRRDVGAGMIASQGERRPRIHLLRSVAGFLTRRTLAPLGGWALALSAYFLLIGLLASSLIDFLEANPFFADLAAQAGFVSLATVQGYAASLIMLLAIPLGLFAVVRVAEDAADEAHGRLALVLSRPVGRIRWAVTEIVVIAAGCLVIALLTAAATWLGAVSVGTNLEAGQAAAGALNILPVALLSLGAATLALGWEPRAVATVGALPVVGGFIIFVLAETFAWPAWLREISPFAHLAAVPATSPNWAGVWTMLAIAAALAALGVVGFARRDLRG
jgi:ABC-2 type transport system permease protein